jgi:CBS domain-containing protein
MTIAAIVNGRDVVSVNADTPVGEVVALLARHGIGAVPVLADGAVAGVFSERDIVHCLAADGAAALELPVGDRMSSPPITVAPDQSVLGALSLMTQRRFRHLPVIEGGRLVGFVSIGDLVKYRIDRIEAEAMAMRDYIQQA